MTKQKGVKTKARPCTEKVMTDMQGVNSESIADGNSEPTDGSDSSLTAPRASAQAECEFTQKVVAEAAGIRRWEAVEGATTNPP